MKNIILLICVMLTLISSAAYAKENIADTAIAKPKLKRFYIGTALDGGIFSTATIQRTSTTNFGGVVVSGKDNSTGTVRFTYFLNIGMTFNFNLSRHFGLYTGIDIKNVGFIDKENGMTYKRRTYNLGVPVGIKIGNMRPKGMYGILGGGADMPFNYKEKYFSDRDEKTKMNEWFSQRTPSIMPYVFVGMVLPHGLSIKGQYYPNNFLNPDFTKNGAAPYTGMDVHLILLSIGFAVPVKDHHNMMMMKKKQKDATTTTNS